METINILIISAIPVILILSCWVSKRLSAILFFIAFIGAVIAITNLSGFNRNWLNDVLTIGVVLFAAWYGINYKVANARQSQEWFDYKFNQPNYSKCKFCGHKKSYHRMPKNLKQILFGGLTCENCGAEFNITINDFKQKASYRLTAGSRDDTKK